MSKPFQVSNGTRQGCPLSPLLFAIVMEHLAIALRRNPDIIGIPTQDNHHKIALYADDLLIYLNNPHINYKSEFLNITLDTSTLELIRSNFPFKICKDSISYLGLKIPQKLSSLGPLNYDPLLTKTLATLNKDDQLPTSWFGRINVLNATLFICLPNLTYRLSPSMFSQA